MPTLGHWIYATTTATAPGHTAGTGAARTGPLSAPFWAGPWTAVNLNLQPEAGHQYGPAGQSRPAVWALGVTRAAGCGAGYRDAGAGMPLPSNGSRSRRQSSDLGCRLWISRSFVTVGTASSIHSSQNLGIPPRPPAGAVDLRRRGAGTAGPAPASANRFTHDVPVLIPKNTSNLKFPLNSIKIRCTNVVPNASIWQYTVGDTLCRQSSTEIEFPQTGWLARRRGSEKHPSEGSRRGARARHSLRKPVAPKFKNGALLKRQV
jgi:hypothetical protein